MSVNTQPYKIIIDDTAPHQVILLSDFKNLVKSPRAYRTILVKTSSPTGNSYHMVAREWQDNKSIYRLVLAHITCPELEPVHEITSFKFNTAVEIVEQFFKDIMVFDSETQLWKFVYELKSQERVR